MVVSVSLEISQFPFGTRNVGMHSSRLLKTVDYGSLKLPWQARYCICLGGGYDIPFIRSRPWHGKFFRVHIISQASKKSRNNVKKDQNRSTNRKGQIEKTQPGEHDELPETSQVEDWNSNLTKDLPVSNLDSSYPPRGAVLQSCIITSGLLFAVGVILRQASHIAFSEGWLKADSSSEIAFGFELWHLELTLGLVALVSACRFTLLKTWPDFAESSEAANKQILSSLEPLDYVLVSCLPGIGEELLFRGALLPLLGVNWQSALVVGAIFGGLHLGNGRKYSFVIWATFVGLVYGLAAIASSSVMVPMAAHSLNNLVAGFLWRQESKLHAK